MKEINSIGFIVDGNRRWAVENGLNKTDGHAYGFNNIIEIVKAADAKNIKQTCFYVFSTENWNRSKNEVEFLMKLFAKKFQEIAAQLESVDAKIRFIGNKSDFSPAIQKNMNQLEAKTSNCSGIEVFFAASYGGRDEIIQAIKKIPKEKIDALNESDFEQYLSSKDLCDPEIIIRTGGDHRLSNFLMWKSAYAELYFTKTKWPDFSQAEFESILDDYRNVRINKGK